MVMDMVTPSSDSTTKRDALARALEVAGSQEALATICGVTQPAVSKWVAKGAIPADYALTVERETGVSRHDIAPEFYPPNLTGTLDAGDGLLGART